MRPPPGLKPNYLQGKNRGPGLSSTLANLGGAWRGTRLRRVRSSGVLLHPGGTGMCEKSGDAREGPSAEVIIAAQDGYKGRLAPAWEMCKARTAHPVEAAPACLSTRRRMRVGSPKIGQSRAYTLFRIETGEAFTAAQSTHQPN